jgi:uncharacterized protein (DUF1778 family)
MATTQTKNRTGVHDQKQKLKKVRAGKPRNDARIDFRLKKELKELIDRAATLTGKSLSDYAVSVLVDDAKRVVDQNSMLVLSNRDRDTFLAALDADPEPNEALKKAARRYKALNG